MWNEDSKRHAALVKDLLLANNIPILNKDGGIPSKEEFSSQLTALGEKLDPRIWPLGLSFLGTGLSIGIIVPILPLLVESLHIPPSQFGLVVSAFGLAKLIGNVPSAQWVEQHGRKLVMVNGMLLCAVGIGSVSLAVDPSFGTTSLIVSRLITGFGVSAFTSAAFMMLADISTNLNRTRTMGPVMASFQAGTALGPAIGGLAVTQLGIGTSYFCVGGMIAALAGLNHLFLRESRPVAQSLGTVTAPSQPGGSFSVASKAWRELLRRDSIRDVVLANTCYWVGLSGTSLTLLPLFMVQPLHLSAAQIGLCFAWSSTIAVLSSQPSAYMADKWGKTRMIGAGLGVLGTSMVALPMCTTSFESLLVMLAPIAIGSTVMGSVPIALMGDLVKTSQRSQALSLLRVAGDVGLLLGATCSGLSAQFLSLGATMGINGVLLVGVAGWWSLRHRNRLPDSDVDSM